MSLKFKTPGTVSATKSTDKINKENMHMKQFNYIKH